MNAVARAIEGIAVRRSKDTDVFDRALRGDPVAFAEVYRRYQDRVFAYCLSRLLSRDAAADAMQEVFLRALSADPSRIGSPSAWLFGVARNVCADATRHNASIVLAEPAEHADATASANAETAEDAALARQAASNTVLALRRMNARYRSALVLRDVHQQPVADIAEALGIEVNAAYTVLCRARDSFGKAYAEVLGLRPACRQAVELSYRQDGTGISPAEKSMLEAHRRVCSACRRETTPAAREHTLTGLALLTPLGSLARPKLLERAAALLDPGAWPWDFAANTDVGRPVAKITMAALTTASAAALVAIPSSTATLPMDRPAVVASPASTAPSPDAAGGSFAASGTPGQRSTMRVRAESRNGSDAEQGAARTQARGDSDDIPGSGGSGNGSGGSTAAQGGGGSSGDSSSNGQHGGPSDGMQDDSAHNGGSTSGSQGSSGGTGSSGSGSGPEGGGSRGSGN